MARIQWVEERLQRWAAACTVGDGSGFPVKSVLHPTWQPPSPGQTPTMKVSTGSDAAATHAAIQCLRPRLQATVCVHYIFRTRNIAEQAALLGCASDTVLDRVERAHRELAELLQGAGMAAR